MSNTNEYSFGHWLTRVFDHPESDREWYFNFVDEWTCDAALTVQHMTHLFEAPKLLLHLYSRQQIGSGLWYLANPSCSNHAFLLQDVSVAWPEREKCLLSISILFEKLFAPLCVDHLGHLDRKGEPDDWPNLACYMWWDLFPTGIEEKHPQRARFNDTLLKTMERQLTIDSEACCESALHGLGHEQNKNSERVAEIIDRFLAKRDDISIVLRRYAEAARKGCIQ